MKYTLLSFTLAGLLFANLAVAEKADAGKEINILSDGAVYSSLKDAGTFSGNIVVTRGSLVMKGGKLDLTKTNTGYQSFVLLAENGKAATFRQKSDSGDDEWIEGEGARIEYSDQSEEMKIFSKAILRRMSGGKVIEEVQGESIVYDSLKEIFKASNSNAGDSVAGAGRIKVVIQSREAQAANTKALPTPVIAVPEKLPSK